MERLIGRKLKFLDIRHENVLEDRTEVQINSRLILTKISKSGIMGRKDGRKKRRKKRKKKRRK